jgi:hypothetical protein
VSAQKGRWWLVVEHGEIDLCLKNPGYDVDVEVAAHIRDLVQVWLGRTPLASALRSRSIRVEGDALLVRGFEKWFSLSMMARAARAAESARGREASSGAA